MNLPIETEDLGKRYGKVTAVKHLSLRVAQGEIYAFLGLNGAGKTTTIRMLLGMIKPTWGTARVFQTRVRPGSRQPWASVGYLVETPHSYRELTVYENLEVARRLHPGTAPQAVGDIIERMGLALFLKGMRSGWDWPRRCCMLPGCFFWTNPPTAWIRPGSSKFVSSCSH